MAAGLLYLHYTPSENWTSPFHSYLPVIVLYLLANAFLAIVPFIPPDSGEIDPDGYPYYVFPVVGIAVLIAGAVYWLFWKRILPRVWGYEVVSEHIIGEDGNETVRYVKVAHGTAKT